MKKVLGFFILVLFLTSCNNKKNDKIDKEISTNQNRTQIDTILQVIKNSGKNANINDTTKYIASETEFNPRAIKLNNKAIELYSYVGGEPVSMHDSLMLDSALVLLNNAIKLDAQYYLAYANKAMILASYKLYTQAIETLNYIIKIRPNYVEGIANQGFLYEKMGDLTKANEKYKEAIEAYLKRLNDPYKIMDGVAVQADIAFMLLFVDGKDKALQLIDTIIARNPDNKTAKFMKGNITAFNREDFISNF